MHEFRNFENNALHHLRTSSKNESFLKKEYLNLPIYWRSHFSGEATNNKKLSITELFWIGSIFWYIKWEALSYITFKPSIFNLKLSTTQNPRRRKTLFSSPIKISTNQQFLEETTVVSNAKLKSVCAFPIISMFRLEKPVTDIERKFLAHNKSKNKKFCFPATFNSCINVTILCSGDELLTFSAHTKGRNKEGKARKLN